jgi:hypothetical protein
MKIKITQIIEIDPEKWANEYGVDIKDVRKDAASYFAAWCQDQVERLGLQKDSDAGSISSQPNRTNHETNTR